MRVTTPEGTVEVKGKMLAAEVNKRLSFTWGSGTSTDATTVVFEITQMGPLVKLLITHRQSDAGDPVEEVELAGRAFGAQPGPDDQQQSSEPTALPAVSTSSAVALWSQPPPQLHSRAGAGFGFSMANPLFSCSSIQFTVEPSM